MGSRVFHKSFTETLDELPGYMDAEVTQLKNYTFKYELDEDSIYALKVIKIEKFNSYEEYKEFFKQFINHIINMTKAQHVATAQLLIWNYVSLLSKVWIKENTGQEPDNMEEDDLDDDYAFHPFIMTKFYDKSLEDEINDKSIAKWDSTQLVLFVYGCLRAFRHMNSFNLIIDSIQTDKILFETNKKNKFLYPIVNDFHSDKNAKISNNLNSFGEILSTITNENDNFKENNPFSPLINKLLNGENQIEDFNAASLMMEYQIIPNLNKDQNFKIDIFNKYKENIENFERDHFVGKKSIDSSNDIEKYITNFEADVYRNTRKLISLALRANSQAAFKVALFYYNGVILPKDLVYCIRFLRFSIQQNEDPVSKSLMSSLVLIKDRKHLNSSVEFDDETLYYKGAFAECDALDLNPAIQNEDISSDDFLSQSISQSCITSTESWSDKIKEAIDFYSRSLNIKNTPVVMGRLGAILTKYSNHSDDALGPQLLKRASDGNDLYGMFNYGLYLSKIKKDNKAAIQIFEKLYERNHIDAALILGNLYKEENDINKAKEYYTKSYEIFGCNEAKKCIDKINAENK